MKKGIVKVLQHENGEYISPIFLTPKSDGSFRLILNLKKLNKHMPYIHFKMDTISIVLELITKDCFMAKVDIKDAYYSVPICEHNQKYLKFFFEGKLYQFTCLPNGLCSGPRKFTKLLKPPLATLRLERRIISGYIDDLITVANTFTKCFENVKECVHLLDSLGFVVHPDKSDFCPTQVIEYLGFIINSQTMTISLTLKKKEKLKELCISILSKSKLLIRDVARLLGNFSASFIAVTYGKLHYRDLEREKILALRNNKGNFDRPIILTSIAKYDIDWWIDHIDSSNRVISHGNPEFVMTTDACNTGWGAVCPWGSTNGLFSENERTSHINVLELKAILFGLKSLCSEVRNTHIKVLCDNTTAVQCINNMGSCVSVNCDKITKEIWGWAISTKNWITLSHIPGILNEAADTESRKNETQCEWQLNKEIFAKLRSYFEIDLDIDLFATRINAQLPVFVSFRPDPEATHVNAFTIDWHDLHIYCFPPFSCILRVIQKIIQDKAKGILVVPNWPNQLWYPLLLDLMICEPLFLPPSKTNLVLPNQLEEVHPLHQHLELMVCHVSGRF